MLATKTTINPIRHHQWAPTRMRHTHPLTKNTILQRMPSHLHLSMIMQGVVENTRNRNILLTTLPTIHLLPVQLLNLMNAGTIVTTLIRDISPQTRHMQETIVATAATVVTGTPLM